MAKEYIEREAVKALFAEAYDAAFMQMHTRDNKEHWCSYSAGINWGLNTITDAPTADVVEVVHGEWLDHADQTSTEFGRMDLKCSVCGVFADDFIGGTEDWFCSDKPNYCPNCGAKMDGKGDAE